MRWLEASPQRYDAGMRLLTLGRVTRLHDAVASAAIREPGERILEIGCGTGAVTERLIARGAEITALDQSAEMLEQAQRRIRAPKRGAVRWVERTASEVDQFESGSFDAAVLSLCLSEMSRDERRFVLAAATACLRPGGRLVVADEVRPTRVWQRALQAFGRGPQWLLGWLLAGSVSRPIARLREELREVGLQVGPEERWLCGTLAVFVATPDSERTRCSTS
jgi:demethylmenaquinone methyltransferase/2-methoxy-6-polyprenyl-1,4-benzoquinol methylase